MVRWDLAFPIYRIFIIVGIGLVMLIVLWWMQDKTRVGGHHPRGHGQQGDDGSLGINYGLVSTLVFLLGAALAGFGGMLGAPILGVFPTMGTVCCC